MKEYRDFYFRKARAENYPARSVYKLKELDAKFGLLKKGIRALDLGAAPGSWSIACAEKVGPAGLILSCDIKAVEIALPAPVIFMRADVFAQSPQFVQALTQHGPFDLVLSDMAPATTGSKAVDQARSANLVRAALELACLNLRPGGNFVAKIFMGADAQAITAEMRAFFQKVKSFKPKSSRAESKETFLVGMGFKRQAESGSAQVLP